MFVKKKVSPIHCLNFGHLSVLLLSFLFSNLALCESQPQDDMENLVMLKMLNPSYRVRGRGPSNFVPDDQIEPLPVESKSWTQQILVEDDAGVLVGIKKDLAEWQETQEYAKTWNLESTGVYDVDSVDTKKAYLQRMILKYADKRLSGEVKKAEEGSALHTVGQAQKALKPNAEANVTENIKLKFKARVLQGKAIMEVRNPYVEYKATTNLKGEVHMDARKEFKEIGVETNANYQANDDDLKVNVIKNFEDFNLQAQIDYEVSQENWTASLQRPIYKKLIGRVSSTQSEKEMILGGESNQRMEVMFNTSF
ncbi:MAG: hypothetical protein CME70_09190 [Halobacteriovorax sp.]|nr:hypothetical protein [Halobacteriovorax sp.]|tara:strand:- start:9925 stop:10854 length:930 start_codon:yes stop_codon:yes gene_type:complete